MQNQIMYLVSYPTGSYDTYYENLVFVTHDEQLAIAYVEKFNRIRKNLQEYHEEFVKDKIWDENSQYNWYRWDRIMDTGAASYTEIDWR
jgi:hypothetical protein